MKRKTIFHSKESEEMFVKFFHEWDDGIETHDDLETQQMMCKILQEAQNLLGSFQTKKEQQIIEKHKGATDAVDELLAIKEKDWYKSITRVTNNLLYLQLNLKHVYELKNRRTEACFKLRKELAEIKMKK